MDSMSKEKKGKETENQIEEKRSQIKISVRNLVEFIFREGDIDNRHGQSVSPEAMLAGSRMHRRIQKRMGSDYHAEVPLKLVIGEENYDLVLEGRADGIQITSESEREIDYSSNFNSMTIEEDMNVVIDEIKGVYLKLEQLAEPVRVHKAQAMCYAYIFALQHDIERIGIQMTYVNLDTEEIKYFHEDFAFSALEEWFDELIRAYKKWSDFQYAWRILRQESIQKLQFPFPYRKGQKELAAGVYRTIKRKKNLFIPKRVVKDFLIKFTKKPQKSARSTFMLLTLRRVGLLFPGKDFFANGLVFRQPFKEGVPAPLYLGQFQRVGGLFSVIVAGHLQHIHRHLGKQHFGQLVGGVNEYFFLDIPLFCADFQQQIAQLIRPEPFQIGAFPDVVGKHRVNPLNLFLFRFFVHHFMSSLAKSFGVYHHQFNTRRLALSAGHICCISFLSIRLILSLMVSVLVLLKWT